jgi:hypothetical protein
MAINHSVRSTDVIFAMLATFKRNNMAINHSVRSTDVIFAMLATFKRARTAAPLTEKAAWISIGDYCNICIGEKSSARADYFGSPHVQYVEIRDQRVAT